MHRRLTAIFAVLTIILTVQVAPAAEYLLVSAGGQVTSYRIDDSSGALAQAGALELGVAGPMTEAPAGGKLFVNTNVDAPKSDSAGGKKRQKTPAIATFTCAADGALTLVETAPSQMSAGYLKVDAGGRFLAGSNYGAGKVSVWALGGSGVFAGALVRTFDLEKCAHSAFFAPDNQTLYVPATGPNKIFQLKFDPKTGAIVPRQPSSAPGPRGETDAKQPRHLIFHPAKPLAYVTHERERPGAGVYTWNEADGTLTLLQSIVSTDPADEEGMTTADLHLSPDARFLYVSNRDIKNRNDPAAGRDSIALFRVDAGDGRLTFEKRFPCPKVPRSFCRNAAGSLLFVSGQGDNRLATYRIDPKTGHLTELSRVELPGRPTWVMCVTR